MPPKKNTGKNSTSTARITPKTLAVLTHLAEDQDGSILAGARVLQATKSDIGIGTIYLRNPNNPRNMDRRIAPVLSGDGSEPGSCEYGASLLPHVSNYILQQIREARALPRRVPLKDRQRYDQLLPCSVFIASFSTAKQVTAVSYQ